jgi:ATP-dependent DNA helicase RecQ
LREQDEIESNSFSQSSHQEEDIIFEDILKLKYKLIYICPERLGLGSDKTPAEKVF